MATRDGIYAVKATLRYFERSPSLPADWDPETLAGMTQLGIVDSPIRKKSNRDIDTLTRAVTGSAPTDVRVTGNTTILQVTVVSYASALSALRRLPSDYKLGHRIPDSALIGLVVVPDDIEEAASSPALLIPRAFVIDDGLSVWHPRIKHLGAAELTVVALHDPVLGDTHFEGDPATWPVYEEEE